MCDVVWHFKVNDTINKSDENQNEIELFSFDKHGDESDNEKDNERNENPDSGQSSNHENIKEVFFSEIVKL